MQNFGKIKNAFNNLLIEAVVLKDKDNKQLFGSYVKAIKENKILKTQFLIFNNIENKVEENEFKANLFLQENIKLLEGFSKEQILEANTALASKINDIPEVIENKELYENISTLIFADRLADIDAVVEATSSIIQYIKENKTKEVGVAIELPTSMVANMLIEKYNSKYSDLEESEFRIIKSLIESSDEEKQMVYKDTLRETIDLVNANLAETDISLDTKEKLLKVKDVLLNDKGEINEDYLTNISKLVELKNSLQ